MDSRCTHGSQPRSLLASKDNTMEELAILNNLELISLLESCFHRSVFIKVANVLKSREESAKADALRHLSLREAAIFELQEENGNLKNELRVLKEKSLEMEERAMRLERELTEKGMELEHKLREEKGRYSLLKEKCDKIELEKILKRDGFERCMNNFATLEGQLAGMEKDCVPLMERSQEAEKKLKNLLEENVKLLDFKVQCVNVKCTNKLLQDEIDALKRMNIDMKFKEIITAQDLAKHKRDCMRLEKQLTDMKGIYNALKERVQNDDQRFRSLIEELQRRERGANEKKFELEIKMKDSGYEKRMLQDDLNAWKCKYSLLEGWILQLLDGNPVLLDREREMGEKKYGGTYQKKEMAELQKSDEADIKERFVSLVARSSALTDICRSDVVVCTGTSAVGQNASMHKDSDIIDFGDYGSDKNCTTSKFQLPPETPTKSSEMKNCSTSDLNAGSHRNLLREKFRLSQTLGVKRVLEGFEGNDKGMNEVDDYNDEDDVIPISKLKMKRFSEAITKPKTVSESSFFASGAMAASKSCLKNVIASGKNAPVELFGKAEQ